MKDRTSWLALAAIVAASSAGRIVAGLARATPSMFPDEYMYAAIGRAFAESGRPLVRDGGAHFPALLQPLLTAPAWLVGNVEVAFRLVQGIESVAMSLAAIPAFLLARRVGVGRGVALVVASVAVLAPDFLYASFIFSEPFAYPLLLASVCAGVTALAAPTRRTQRWFVLFVGLTAFARLEFAALPVVFLAAGILVGLRERTVRRTLREQLRPLVALFAPALLVIAAPAVLGSYRGGLDVLHLHPLAAVRWAALDAMLLTYASGWIVVPGALLGLWLALTKARSREELAFAAFTVPLILALVGEAGVLQSGIDGVSEIQERYVFYAIPLAAIAFALYASRGWPLRLPHLAIGAALVLMSVRLPLAGYAIPARISGSPLLYGVQWLSWKVGELGTASLAVAAVAGVLTVAATAASRWPRIATPLALSVTVSALGAASAGAVAFDAEISKSFRRDFLPNDPSWVDKEGFRDVTLVQAAAGGRTDALIQLFWNRSVRRVALLPGGLPVDGFAYRKLRIAGDGALISGGRPLTGPVLVDHYAADVRLRGARLVATSPMRRLWQPHRLVQISFYGLGVYYDGWLAPRGGFAIWPAVAHARVSGRLSFTVTAPRSAGHRVRVRVGSHSMTLAPGERRRVALRVCARGWWHANFQADMTGLGSGLRLLSVRATRPRFEPSRAACGSSARRVLPIVDSWVPARVSASVSSRSS